MFLVFRLVDLLLQVFFDCEFKGFKNVLELGFFMSKLLWKGLQDKTQRNIVDGFSVMPCGLSLACGCYLW
jgi:hypothetical protein